MTFLLRLDQSFAEELCLPAFLVGWEIGTPLALPMRGASTATVASVMPSWWFTPPLGWKPDAASSTRDRLAERAIWRTGWRARLGELSPYLRGRATSLVELQHSIEGYACGTSTFVGVLLRLAAHAGDAPAARDPIVELFTLMAQDPVIAAVVQRAPELRDAVGTHGTPYTATQLGRLHARLSAGFPCPPFERGVEAAVQLAPCDPLEVFAGYRVLVATVDDDGVAFRDDRIFDGELIGQLAAVGARLGRTDPRAFFLWVNSD
jgi:hypothetical protein